MRLAVALLFAAGCYSPAPGTGAPCTTDRECPDPLRCVANTCGGEARDGALNDSSGDVIDSLASDAQLGMWSPPLPIGGVNTDNDESDPSFTQDRLTIVFTSDRAGDDDIYIGVRLLPTDPFLVTALTAVNSTPAEEHSPEISPDGKTLYFTTSRLGNFDVFKAVQSGGIWQAPTRVDELSSTSTEGDVAISPDGLVAIVARSGRFYRSTRADASALWETPVQLAGMFGSAYAAPAFNGNLDLYHHANGTDRDLFVARRNGTGFAATASITELASTARDAAPFVSADDRYLMFECSRTICESSR